MSEFWVCQHCRSLNRAGTGRCYHCRQKFGSMPKPAKAVAKSAEQAAVYRSAPVDSGPEPSYLSRPAAYAPSSFGEGTIGGVDRTERKLRRPHLTNPIRKRIAWALVTRPSVSISWLGYLTAAMLSLVLLGGLLIVANGLPTALKALQSGSPQTAWQQLDASQQGSLQALAVVLAAIGVVALFCFSLFVGLTTHNATGLGAETPLLTPYRAGICWLQGLWAQARLAFALVVPAILIWLGYPIPGLLLGIVALEIAQRRLGDPVTWLTRPTGHLPDLYLKLGIDGATRAPIVTIWSICFRVTHVLAIAVLALPALGLMIVTAMTLTDRPDISGWQASGYGSAQIGIAVLVGATLAITAAGIALLIPITIELVKRQGIRRTLVRAGRARPWEARPQSVAPVQPASTLYDPYDRPDDHASLYSPSTTSSPVWSDEPSGEPPS